MSQMLNVSNQMSKNGFSLIEVIIVLAILVVISGLAFSAGYGLYRSQPLVSEKDSLVSLLRRARAKAMNNINQSDHGVFIGSSKYTVFQGGSYAGRDAELDEEFPRLAGATLEGPTEIVFSALEGAANTSGTIAISTASGRVETSVNYEGRISW